MSLINQVLRQLDARTASVAAVWPAAVRATPLHTTPAGRPTPARSIAVASLAGLCMVAAAWLVAVPGGSSAEAVGQREERVAAGSAAQAAAPVLAAVPLLATAPAALVASVPPSASVSPVVGQAVAADSVVLAADAGATAGTTAGASRAPAPEPAPPEPPRRIASSTTRAVTPVEPPARSRPLALTVAMAMAAVSPSPSLPVPIPEPLPLEPAGTVRIEKRLQPAKPHERADAAYRQGLAAQERGDPAEAARAYAAALQDEAALVPARIGLVSVLMAQSRIAEAEALLQAGLALDPQQPLLAQPMARLLVDRGELASAIDLMRTALPAGARIADYQACLAALLQRAGREREAAAHFDAALRLRPDNGVWWMGLAMSLAAQGQGEVARTAYARARNSGQLSPELMHFVEMRMREPL